MNGFQSRLHFAGALVTFGGFFCETTLDNGPETRRNWGTERGRHLAHDAGTDFEASASTEGQFAGRGFVKNDAERPKVAAAVGWFAAQNFGRHVVQRAADGGNVLRAGEGLRWAFEDCAAGAFGEAKVQDLY